MPEPHHAPARPGEPAASDFGAAIHVAMRTMERTMAAAPMTGDPDQDFLAMMVPHHEGAVEMARLVLVSGRDPLVRRLAEEIIASQQAEIGSMRRRLTVLAGGGTPEYPPLSGTRGPLPR
jgi:uncharacterized protein (DUF305 family)